MVACLFAVLVVASARIVVQCLAPSSGCLASNSQRLQSGNHLIDVSDPFLGNISRRFVLWASSTHHANEGGIQHHAAPLLLGFHGQDEHPEWLYNDYPTFIDLADKHGYTLVYPAAVVEAYWDKDNSTNKQQFGSSWNVGNARDNYTCLPATNTTRCTRSCQRLAKCGSCTWATCYSDIDALKQLLRHLEKELCLDTSRYYMFGISNGGMFVHYVLQEMPGRFLAAAPMFGSPLLGYVARFRHQLVWEQQLMSKTSVIQFHDRSDIVIPWQGGTSYDGWLYEPMVRVMDAWAAVHECVKYQNPLTTPDSGGPYQVGCMQFANCSLGGRVAYCLYNGEHNDIPLPTIANLAYDFFESVHSSSHESNVKMGWWSYWSGSS